MESLSWQDVLNMKGYLINMDKSVDRLQSATKRLKNAGFTNVQRYKAVDGQVDDLDLAWSMHGSPQLDQSDPLFTHTYKAGKQGCALSHYGIWKQMIDEKIQYALVFEDDIEFHCSWHQLAEQYWNGTPRNFDILYLSGQMEPPVQGHIVVTPVYCTHAYMLTLEGAQKLYNMCINFPKGSGCIDGMIINYMRSILSTFQNNIEQYSLRWFVWNAFQFDDPNRSKRPDFIGRNGGLVFQDGDFKSHVCESYM